jgi:hypothetical protein
MLYNFLDNENNIKNSDELSFSSPKDANDIRNYFDSMQNNDTNSFVHDSSLMNGQEQKIFTLSPINSEYDAENYAKSLFKINPNLKPQFLLI